MKKEPVKKLQQFPDISDLLLPLVTSLILLAIISVGLLDSMLNLGLF